MNIKFAENGLMAEGNMALAAKSYERSTASIVLQVVVGVLTLGIGALGIEAYYSSNKKQQQRDFVDLAGRLLKGMQETQDLRKGFKVPYKGSAIEFIPKEKGVDIHFEGEKVNLKNSSLNRIRRNLKKDILRNMDIYGPELAKMALRERAGLSRHAVIEFLEKRFKNINVDGMHTEKLVKACLDLIDNKREVEEIEKELKLNAATFSMIVDKECVELLANAENQKSSRGGKVNYIKEITRKDALEIRPEQSKDEIRVRKFLAEMFFPEKAWELDIIETGERTKSVFIHNADLLAELFSKSELIDAADLTEDLNVLVKSLMKVFKYMTNIGDGEVSSDEMAEILKSLPVEAYRGFSDLIDENIAGYDIGKIGGGDLLLKIDGIPKDNFGKFMSSVLKNYFANQHVVDKRAMLASFLENSGSKDANEAKLVALLKASGPYMQKMLQLLGDNAEGRLQVELNKLKANLTPINDDIVEAVLLNIVDESEGKIHKIDVSKSLGAASVGQTVQANIHWENRPEPEEVVIKILRPGIRLRADREEKFFESEAKKFSGMDITFKGISDQIKAELDLRKEAHNVGLAKVYNKGYKNLQAMSVIDKIRPAQGYMLLKKVQGNTVDSIFKELEERIKYPIDTESDVKEIGYKLSDGIKSLTKKWVTEAFFGSGFYHGDLHSGNVMFSNSASENGLLTVIDFGNAAVLSLEQRKAVFKMILASVARNADVFVKNYEKIMSDGGKKLAAEKEKRAVLVDKVRAIMSSSVDPGKKVADILRAATELSLEIPSVISNFSRSQMMLQNSIKKINELNVKIDRKIGNYLNTPQISFIELMVEVMDENIGGSFRLAHGDIINIITNRA